MKVRAIIVLIAAVLSQPAQSENRIQLLHYDPDHVIELPVTPGYAAIVEFGKDETVEDVVVGNSTGWQVTPDSSGQRIVVKPLAAAPTTNMIVLTETRRYTFVLSSSGEGKDLFVVHFSYPPETSSAGTLSAQLATYKFRGSKALFPVEMHDDGKYTTITWNNQTVLPAVFAVEGGKEEITNGRMVGANYIVEGVAPEFVLRLGEAQAVASRKAFKVRK